VRTGKEQVLKNCNRAVFLDRDGVINPLVYNQKSGAYESPKRLADFRIFPEVKESLEALKGEGYFTFLVSNQPDAAKGKAKMKDLLQIEAFFTDFCQRSGSLMDAFYYCHHHPDGIVPKYTKKCRCRKPGIYFLEQARDTYGVCLSESYFIGDRETDILCGRNAGCKTIRLIRSHMQADREIRQIPDKTCANLLEAVSWIIQNDRSKDK